MQSGIIPKQTGSIRKARPTPAGQSPNNSSLATPIGLASRNKYIQVRTESQTSSRLNDIQKWECCLPDDSGRLLNAQLLLWLVFSLPVRSANTCPYPVGAPHRQIQLLRHTADYRHPVLPRAIPLRAPVSGAMVRTIHEHPSCGVCYRFEENGIPLLELDAPNAAFEYEF